MQRHPVILKNMIYAPLNIRFLYETTVINHFGDFSFPRCFIRRHQNPANATGCGVLWHLRILRPYFDGIWRSGIGWRLVDALQDRFVGATLVGITFLISAGVLFLLGNVPMTLVTMVFVALLSFVAFRAKMGLD